jgi:hypothetical protein
MCINWKSKEKKGETIQELAQHIIEKKHIYINTNPLTKVLGLYMTKRFFTSKEIENYREAKSTPPQHFAPWQKKA